jgi:hypothetical protein
MKKTRLLFRATPARFALVSLACCATFLALTFVAHSQLTSREKGLQLRRRMDFYPYPATTISPHHLPELLAPVDESVEEMMHETSASLTENTVYPAPVDVDITSTGENNRKLFPNKQTSVRAREPVSDDKYSTGDSEDLTNTSSVENETDLSSSLRDKFRARSLETKRFIRDLLHEVFPRNAEPNPRYNLHHPQDLFAHTDINNRSCGQLDAFAGVPIHDAVGNGPWEPPIGSPLEKVKEWKAAYVQAIHKIKEVSVGGSELRDIAAVEVQDLRALRHNLFCGDS